MKQIAMLLALFYTSFWVSNAIGDTGPALVDAALAASAAYDTGSVPGYIQVSDSSFPNSKETNGFHAAAFEKGNEIIIAVRGTDPSGFNKLVYNLFSDTSFATGDPTSSLRSEVAQLVAFLAQVVKDHPGAKITLAGHSLGGALAQIVGQAANLPVISFDAPGALLVVKQLADQLAPLKALPTSSGPTQAVVNYRLRGDQISLIGTQIGTTVTVGNVYGDVAVDKLAPTYFLDFHSIATLISQIGTRCASVLAVTACNNQSKIVPTSQTAWCDISSCASTSEGAMLAKVVSSYGSAGFVVTSSTCADPVLKIVYGYSSQPVWYAACSFQLQREGQTIQALEGAVLGVPVPPLVPNFSNDTLGLNIVPNIALGEPAGLQEKIEGVVLRVANALFIDPPPGYSYLYEESSTSPFVASVGLPIVDSIAGWNLRYHDESGWSPFTTNMVDGLFAFNTNVDALNFLPVDNQGNPMFNPNPFFYEMAFQSPGTFNASVTTVDSISADVPEPPSFALYGAGLLALLILQRRSKRTKLS